MGQMREEEIRATILKALQEAGVPPEIIYAFKKTGRVLTEETAKRCTPAELKEWNDAIEEYRRTER